MMAPTDTYNGKYGGEEGGKTRTDVEMTNEGLRFGEKISFDQLEKSPAQTKDEKRRMHDEEIRVQLDLAIAEIEKQAKQQALDRHLIWRNSYRGSLVGAQSDTHHQKEDTTNPEGMKKESVKMELDELAIKDMVEDPALEALSRIMSEELELEMRRKNTAKMDKLIDEVLKKEMLEEQRRCERVAKDRAETVKCELKMKAQQKAWSSNRKEEGSKMFGKRANEEKTREEQKMDKNGRLVEHQKGEMEPAKKPKVFISTKEITNKAEPEQVHHVLIKRNKLKQKPQVRRSIMSKFEEAQFVRDMEAAAEKAKFAEELKKEMERSNLQKVEIDSDSSDDSFEMEEDDEDEDELDLPIKNVVTPLLLRGEMPLGIDINGENYKKQVVQAKWEMDMVKSVAELQKKRKEREREEARQLEEFRALIGYENGQGRAEREILTRMKNSLERREDFIYGKEVKKAPEAEVGQKVDGSQTDDKKKGSAENIAALVQQLRETFDMSAETRGKTIDIRIHADGMFDIHQLMKIDIPEEQPSTQKSEILKQLEKDTEGRSLGLGLKGVYRMVGIDDDQKYPAAIRGHWDIDETLLEAQRLTDNTRMRNLTTRRENVANPEDPKNFQELSNIIQALHFK